MLSSYSMFMLNPVKEIDEMQQELASSTKYISETSEMISQTSMIKREEKGTLMQILKHNFNNKLQILEIKEDFRTPHNRL